MSFMDLLLVVVPFLAGILWKDHIYGFNRKLALRSAKRNIKYYEDEQEVLEKGIRDKNREFRGYFFVLFLTLSSMSIMISLLAAYVILGLESSWYGLALLPFAIWGAVFPWMGMKIGFGYGDPKSIAKLQAKIDKVKGKYSELSGSSEADS